jgi:hypothetical protein
MIVTIMRTISILPERRKNDLRAAVWKGRK